MCPEDAGTQGGNMNRRTLIKSLAFTGAAGALGIPAARSEAEPADGFRFLYFTDTHIQPELDAAGGCRMCFGRMAHEPAEFAICGGDLVFDVLAVDRSRADMLWALYKQTSVALHVPVHYVIGNHDVFGLSPKSGVSPSDPEYGKKAFQDRYGATHYSFDHKGWHFVVLDSIGLHPDRTWTGEVGNEQRAWLRADLDKAGKTTPVIVITHVPLVTGAVNYVTRAEWLKKTPNVGSLVDTLMVTDAAEVIDVLLDYNVRVVLQGHTHINEEIDFRGLRFMTSGAVSGNWWQGVRAGSAEGYSIVSLGPNGTVTREYRTYGFKAVV
jgi:3',5'-cyclic-AMP phosphodiesterase